VAKGYGVGELGRSEAVDEHTVFDIAHARIGGRQQSLRRETP
jgi:hypothetical protein